MDLEVVTQIILFILIIISALMVTEVKQLVRMALSFSIMSALIAILFLTYSATYAALFQLAIYSGFIPVIILVVVALTKGGEDVED